MQKCAKTHNQATISRDSLEATACQCGKLDEVLLDGQAVDFESLDTRIPELDSLQAEAQELLDETIERLF